MLLPPVVWRPAMVCRLRLKLLVAGSTSGGVWYRETPANSGSHGMRASRAASFGVLSRS